MNKNTWYHIDTGPAKASLNMAIDEVLLRQMKTVDTRPILRFYTWSEPAISVGYFQDVMSDFDLSLCERRGWQVVRRLTGGRAVFHDHELTYSVFLPLSMPGLAHDLLGSYRYISQGLLLGLQNLGVEAEMVSLHKRKAKRKSSMAQKSPDCFASPSWYEISAQGKKVVGSAQKRLPQGFLQQGSILVSDRYFSQFRQLFRQSSDKGVMEKSERRSEGMTTLTQVMGREPSLDELKEAILHGFERAHGIRFMETRLTPHEQELAQELVISRYGRNDWNLNRKPSILKRKPG